MMETKTQMCVTGSYVSDQASGLSHMYSLLSTDLLHNVLALLSQGGVDDSSRLSSALLLSNTLLLLSTLLGLFTLLLLGTLFHLTTLLLLPCLVVSDSLSGTDWFRYSGTFLSSDSII